MFIFMYVYGNPRKTSLKMITPAGYCFRQPSLCSYDIDQESVIFLLNNVMGFLMSLFIIAVPTEIYSCYFSLPQLEAIL